MFSQEFEKNAFIGENLVGKGLAATGSFLRKNVPSMLGNKGLALERSGAKHIASHTKKVRNLERASLGQKYSTRVKEINRRKDVLGKDPLKVNKRRRNKSLDIQAERNIKERAKPSPKPDPKKSGVIGFVKRNPISSAIGAGTVGYMVGKPSAQPNYQYDRPML